MAEWTVFFGWAAAINLLILILATVGIVALQGFATGIHTRMFGLDDREVRIQYFQYLSNFKIATLIFSVTPYLALRIMQS